MDRREYLTTIGVIGLGGIAGCTEETGDEAQGSVSTGAAATTESSTTTREPTTEEPTTEEKTTEEPTIEEQTTEEITTEEPQNQETLLEVSINWQEIESTVTNQAVSPQYLGFSAVSQSNEYPVTHIGARLEYPEANAVFAQATQKESAEQEGVIRMDVPAGERANLYVAAVSNSQDIEDQRDEEVALSFASVENVDIKEGTTNQFNAGGFNWIETEWFVTEEYEDEYDSGTFIVDKDEERFNLPYKVTYPFHSGQDVSYSELLVRLNGTGWINGKDGNYYEFYVSAEHPSPGNELETNHEFYPKLDSKKFNLPGNGHIIKPEGEFTVKWE